MLRRAYGTWLLATACVGAIACGSTALTDLSDSPPPATNASDAGSDTPLPPNVSGAGVGTGAFTGLPCDVQQVLETSCVACHTGATAVALLTYADLTAPSASAPAKTRAVLALERMKSTTSPMPPPPALAPTADEVATFQAWVTAGTPMGARCTDTPDGGATGPFSTPATCTSKTLWTRGTNASMRPGEACQTCHQQQGGPRFSIGGTVFPTAHEPNDCNAANTAPLTVVVTDAKNVVTNLTVNAVGNFESSARITPPFHVKVTDGTKTRAMSGSLTAGDCNSCHTQAGANGAPGRILAP